MGKLKTHIPVLQAARIFRLRAQTCGQPSIDVHFEVRHKAAFQEVERP